MAIEPEPVRIWGGEGAPRTIEPQTPAEKLADAADKVGRILRAHLVKPDQLGIGESRVAAQQFRAALGELERTWEEFDPGVAEVLRRGSRPITQEGSITAEKTEGVF